MYKVDIELVKSIEWNGNAIEYDTALSLLGPPNKSFFVYNPWIENSQSFHVREFPDTNQCVVYKHDNNWVIKYFPKNWTAKNGYKEISLDPINNKIPLDDFFEWSQGFKKSLDLVEKLEIDPINKDYKQSLYKLCSKISSEYSMHGALDAILYYKTNKLDKNYKLILNPDNLKIYFDTHCKRLS